jgi:hypothetical protein
MGSAKGGTRLDRDVGGYFHEGIDPASANDIMN